ncbi:segregation/condensation protein A [Aciduliprofundum sp. MAR08-339]|uniref:segregation/condensation protein A n=1 Tax=Aciduliprofundum sp. (strain MAR08-339) TaxID=673860 RepID=UPI00064ED241
MQHELTDHLMYYKALLDEDIDIDYYIHMARTLEEGIHISAKNPVDKAVAIAFELVLDEKLDPWKIDLMKFTKLYLERIRKEREIDFIIAGRIIYMAWNVLMKKSKDVLEEAEREMYYVDEDFFDIDVGAFEFDEEEFVEPSIEIKEPVRREEERPVSLMELIQAINEARREVEIKKRQRKIREKFKFNLDEKVHREDLEEEIKEVWARLSEVHGEEISLSMVYDGTREDFIKVFLSLLFLEKFDKVELHQDVPYGEITIKILIPEELRNIEFINPPEISLETI